MSPTEGDARPDVPVSVVVPSRNRPAFLRHAIASALAQTGVTLEVVVVDDGSTPPIDAAAFDPRVRVLRNEPSVGVARARNQGVEAARGRWIAFLDDDDLWAPEKLAVQLARMREHEARWSITGTVCVDEQDRVRWIHRPAEAPIDLPELRGHNAVGTPSGVLAERSLVLEAGGFDERFSVFADWDLWLRMATISPALGIPEPLLAYRIHGSSMHRRGPDAIQTELDALLAHHRALPSGPLDPARTELWIARGQRDSGHTLRGAGGIVRWGRRHDAMRRALWVLLADPVAERIKPARRPGAEPTPTWARSLPPAG